MSKKGGIRKFNLNKLKIMIRYFLFTITFSVLQAFACMGQQNQLKGPAAKNHKVWNNSQASRQISVAARTSPKGPLTKNFKPWESESKNSTIVMMERKELTGPKAKNMHHFKGSEINQVQVSKAN